MRHLRLQTRVFHRSTHCGRWIIDAEYERKAMFHLVAQGRCVLRIGSAAADIALHAGDTVLFTAPCDHRLVSAADADEADSMLLLCGYFEFDSPLSAVLLASLPEYLLLRSSSTSDQPDAGTPSALLKLILAEAESQAPGAAALMDKLSDALFMYAVRQCLRDGSVQGGVLRGLSDPHVGPALLAMHHQPDQPWTVASLAGLGHLSRAAFARRFAQSVGSTPMDYLTRLRMQLAKSALAERGISVIEAAVMAGYATEAAFSRAFKRIYGCSPGASRTLRSRVNPLARVPALYR
jgi:AraC-type DNA-binding domain-containing proteins